MRAVRDGTSKAGKSRPAQDRVRLFARCELKLLCCYINPDFSVKVSDVREHSERIFCPEKRKQKEKRGGHKIKCLLTKLGRAGRENIRHSVMAHGPRCTRSVRHDLGPNIFPSGPPTQSMSTLSVTDISTTLTNSSSEFVEFRGPRVFKTSVPGANLSLNVTDINYHISC